MPLSAWSVRVGCPMDRMSYGCSDGHLLDKWIGQDSGTSQASEGEKSNGYPMGIHWTVGLEGTVKQTLFSEGGISSVVPVA